MSTVTLIREGDWVSGVSQQDEKFIGYVEAVSRNGNLTVRITQCDRAEAVGTSVEAATAKARKLPDHTPSAPGELRDLIELALATHDKEWFDELTAKLAAPAAVAESAGENRHRPLSYRSRLHKITE